MEALLAAESHDDFRYWRGYYDGHVRTKNLLPVLVSLGETGDKEWIKKQVDQGLRGLLLMGQEPEPQVEQAEVDRISRVMRARARAAEAR